MSSPGANQDVLAMEGGPKLVEEEFPFAGFGAELVGKEEEEYVIDALRKGALARIHLPFAESYVHRFEEKIRATIGTKYLYTVNSGSHALYSAVTALGIGPGDEVLVSGFGWLCCPASVIMAGAVPIPYDVTTAFSPDLEDLKAKLTPRTKAIMVVHISGVAADMDPVLAFAKEHGLMVIEDCAQSFGTTYKGKMVGTLGDAGIYSFNVQKIVTTGEGGAVTFKDGAHFARGWDMTGMYRTYHRFWDDGENPKRVTSELPSMTYRISEISGAIGVAQMEKLDRVLGTLRTRNRELREGVAKIPGLRFAKIADASGISGAMQPLEFDTAEQANFFAGGMWCEGATAIAPLRYFFAGGEARGAMVLAASENFDPSEFLCLVAADGWKCVTERHGVTDKLDPWKLANIPKDDWRLQNVFQKSRERLANLVALRTNVNMTEKHTAIVLKAAEKVMRVMRQRFDIKTAA